MNAAKSTEFTPVKDTNDGYEFSYPVGWQEVAVRGQARLEPSLTACVLHAMALVTA